MKTRANAMSPKSAGASRRASAIIMARVRSFEAPRLQHAQTMLRTAAREIEPMDELESTKRTLVTQTPTAGKKTNRGSREDAHHIRREVQSFGSVVPRVVP